MPDRIIHIGSGHRFEVAHGRDRVVLTNPEWRSSATSPALYILTPDEAHLLATALHVQADHAEELTDDRS